MKRMLSIILAVLLLMAVMPPAQAIDNMGQVIQSLSSYMSGANSVVDNIDNIIDSFAQFGNRDRAVEFKFYSMLLRCIEQEDWDQANSYLRVLTAMKFDDYLTGNDFVNYMQSNGIMNNGYTNIRPVSEVEKYIEGRMAIADGRLDDAFEAFLSSYSVLDAAKYLEMSMGGVDVSTEKQYNRAYDLYAEGNIDEALQILVKIKDSNELAAALYDVLIGEKKSSIVTPIPTPTPTPRLVTPAPATQAPTTPAAKTGYWSDWSTTAPSGSAKTETKTQYRGRSINTQYRYRTLSQTTTRNQELSGATLVSSYNDYGSWSDWSDSAISSSSTRDVETRTVNQTRTVTKYSYSSYRYIGKNGNHWYAPYDYSKNSNYVRDGQWLYKTSDTKLEKAGTVKCSDGKTYTYYGHYWYNETVTTEEEVVGTKTQYRSRDIYIVRVYNVWSSWSGWSNTHVSASSTCEVETQQDYGYWSSWEDTKLNSSSTYQVETRTLYRYWIS